MRDIQYLRIEKSKDGVAGGYKLGAVTVRVNGATVGAAAPNKWLEDDHRTFTIPGFVPSSPSGAGVPVWMDLREDDILYGADDQGDVNKFDARNAVVTAYQPGTPEQLLVKGGSSLGGRLNWGGDKAQMTYKLETFDTTIPQPPPPPSAPTSPDITFTQFEPSGFTVKNIGTAPTGAFNVQIVSQTPQTFNYPIASLAPGASASQSTGFPCLLFTGTADSAGQVVESDESNNGATYAPEFC